MGTAELLHDANLTRPERDNLDFEEWVHPDVAWFATRRLQGDIMAQITAAEVDPEIRTGC